MRCLAPSKSESAFGTSIRYVLRPHAPRLRHTRAFIQSIFHHEDTAKIDFCSSTMSSIPDKERDPMSPVARFFRQYSAYEPLLVSTSDFYAQLCIRELFITHNPTTFICAMIELALVGVGGERRCKRPVCCSLCADDSQTNQVIYIEREVKCKGASVGLYLFILYVSCSYLCSASV